MFLDRKQLSRSYHSTANLGIRDYLYASRGLQARITQSESNRAFVKFRRRASNMGPLNITAQACSLWRGSIANMPIAAFRSFAKSLPSGLWALLPGQMRVAHAERLAVNGGRAIDQELETERIDLGVILHRRHTVHVVPMNLVRRCYKRAFLFLPNR